MVLMVLYVFFTSIVYTVHTGTEYFFVRPKSLSCLLTYLDDVDNEYIQLHNDYELSSTKKKQPIFYT